MIHFRDILSGTQLFPQLQVIVDEAKNGWLRDLGKNDFYHSQSVEGLLDRIVPDTIKKDQNIFDHGEIFLLLTSVYLHDIGRKSVEERHELESYNLIKTNFTKFHLPNSFIAEAVAQICAAHSPEQVWPIDRCDKNYGIAGLTSSGRTFNLQKLGALLRIGDELDNAYVRVKGISGQDNSPRQMIRDINPIPGKGVIEIQAESRNWEEWNRLVDIRDRCQKRLNEVIKYLEQIGLSYYQVWLSPDEFFAPLSPSENENAYYDMVEAIATVVSSHYSSIEILAKIKDSEISVLCTDKRLGITSRTAIIVREELSIKSVHEISGVLLSLKKGGYINHGLVVVRKVPFEDILSAMSSKGFPIITFSTLVDDLNQFEQAMRRQVNNYQSNEIFLRNLYISLSGSLESGKKVDDLDNFITSWLNDAQQVQLTVLGDFGAGKTTLSERITYTAAMQYLEKGSEKRIPVLIHLKDFGATYSIESAITDTLVNQIGVEMSYKAFQTLNKAGRFLLILDGFDEIPNLFDQDSVLRAFREIDKLMNNNSKVILTCRTHFFKTNVEIHMLHQGTPLYDSIDRKFGYSFVFVNPFSQTQIEEYLNRWAGDDSAKYLKVIKNVYNLSDLATRPALLNIIVKTIPLLAELEMSAINAANLYELYIRFWLERDDWRSKLKPQDRSILAELLSEYLFVQNISNIHYSRLTQIVAMFWKESKDHYSLEVLDYELRTCNFLRRDHENNYSFVHKSFLEYLLARKICNQVFDVTSNVGVKWILPIEIDSMTTTKLPIVSNEAETFFLQLLEIRLRETSLEQIENITKDRARAQNIISRSFFRLQLENCGFFYTKLLLEHKSSNNRDFLANAIMKSPDWRTALFIIKEQIQSNSQDEILREIIDALQTNADSEQVQRTNELEELLEEHQSIFIRKMDDVIAVQDYPFSRARAKEELAHILAGIHTQDKIEEARQNWQVNWYRKKTEYDRKQRLEKIASQKERDEVFKLDLKRKRKNP